jgi:CubicO group peptidase (beta-lactamase class C family)
MTHLAHLIPHAYALFEKGVETGLHTGAQLYVALEGQVVADEGLGESREELPMTRDHLTLWMSSVKPLTAVAMAQLCESGAAALTDPVSLYLPAFAAGGKDAITIEHLLTHTGGFRTADADDVNESWEDAVRRVCAAPLEPGWVPGVKAGYHVNGSWVVLGALVEQLSGMTFQEYMRARVLEPAGMEHTWLGLPDELDDEKMRRLAPMYILKPTGLQPHPTANTPAAWSQVWPAGNGRGPIRELGRFYEALQEDGRLIGEATRKEWTARRRVGLFDETFRHIMDWGLGFMPDNNQYGVETAPYGFGRHCSASTYGHSGSQSSAAFADPEAGLVVAVAFNGMPGEPRHQKRIRAFLSAIYEDLHLVDA